MKFNSDALQGAVADSAVKAGAELEIVNPDSGTLDGASLRARQRQPPPAALAESGAMTNLNWFQPRNLAEGERRAIRRAGWQKWLLYRFRLWLISTTDTATNLETRRVATTDDFRDSEFLAKDWTDELYEGGAYPPCTTAGPATALPESVSGGAGGWTRSADLCGGYGQGGGVQPPAFGSDGSVPTLTATLVAYDGTQNLIDPGSYGPVDFSLRLNWSLPPNSIPDGILHAWTSGAGLDFSSQPVTASDPISGADGPVEQAVGYPMSGGGGHGWTYHFSLPNGLYSTGSHFATARLVLTDSARTRIITHLDLPPVQLWTP